MVIIGNLQNILKFKFSAMPSGLLLVVGICIFTGAISLYESQYNLRNVELTINGLMDHNIREAKARTPQEELEYLKRDEDLQTLESRSRFQKKKEGLMKRIVIVNKYNVRANLMNFIKMAASLLLILGSIAAFLRLRISRKAMLAGVVIIFALVILNTVVNSRDVMMVEFLQHLSAYTMDYKYEINRAIKLQLCFDCIWIAVFFLIVRYLFGKTSNKYFAGEE